MKKLTKTSLIITVLFAVIAGFFVARQQKTNRIISLLESPATTDNLSAIKLLQGTPFEQLVEFLTPLIGRGTDASIAAEELLVSQAFLENRIEDLGLLGIDNDLYESVIWWSKNPSIIEQTELTIENNSSSWLHKLNMLINSNEKNTSLHELLELPIRDRDGSVLLTVLAVEKHAPEELPKLIIEWANDYEIEKQIASALISAMTDSPLQEVHTYNSLLSTIRTIINEQNFQLAWRSLHNSDGTINPDIALAALTVNEDKFMPILVKSAKDQIWKHPEHPIVIANRFKPNITSKIPYELLKNDESRAKWWSLFACGLLLEKR
ncbi:MAG: hypothetical protein QF718_05655 [Phycisphaerales bacterium]|nr:hypothetical protein [Phycisphaerales bacterium]